MESFNYKYDDGKGKRGGPPKANVSLPDACPGSAMTRGTSDQLGAGLL